MPLWLFAFVYLISGGVMYVVRSNTSLGFGSFLASLDVCRMQNMEHGIQTVGACALALAHGTFPPTYHFEDVSQLQFETVNHVLFVCVLYFDSLELFDSLKMELYLNFV